jgi:hypothetical protein
LDGWWTYINIHREDAKDAKLIKKISWFSFYLFQFPSSLRPLRLFGKISARSVGWMVDLHQYSPQRRKGREVKKEDS